VSYPYPYMFALHLVLLVGQLIMLGMMWHLWQIVSLHHRRADWEWEQIKAKLDLRNAPPK